MRIQTRPLKKYNIETEYEGLIVRGNAVVNDWEGDPNVVRGINYLPPHLEDVDAIVIDSDGDETSVWHLLSEKAQDSICAALLETEA